MLLGSCVYHHSIVLENYCSKVNPCDLSDQKQTNTNMKLPSNKNN